MPSEFTVGSEVPPDEFHDLLGEETGLLFWPFSLPARPPSSRGYLICRRFTYRSALSRTTGETRAGEKSLFA